MPDIHQIIAAVSPDLYCDPEKREEVKKKTKQGFAEGVGYKLAIEKAKPIKGSEFDLSEAKNSPLSAKALQAPLVSHKLVYDSPNEGLEPIYFWILDFMNGMFRGNVKKISDTFVSSVGSGHFSELGQKASRMQEEAMKMFGAANQVLKSVLNIVYDLREFEIRLQEYDLLNSKDPQKKRNGMLAIKQIWLDSVDIKRGNSSIKAMAQQFDFVTVLDAFMAAKSAEELKELDLNERVRRILAHRLSEFELWVKESERELRKRFEIEKTYLKSQVSSLKLYSRWIKPYLEAARKLEQKDYSKADLVSVFNTLILELTLMGESSYDPADDVSDGSLPEMFKKVTERKYSSIVIVDFKFRGIPSRAGQGYAFGGRAEVAFTSYALNDQEIKAINDELKKDDLTAVMSLIENATTESLGQIQNDIDKYLKNESEEKDKEEKEEKKKSAEQDINPFSSLFSYFFKYKEDKKDKKDESGPIKPDTKYEKIIRSQAIIGAREKCYTTFEIYKKGHRMPAP